MTALTIREKRHPDRLSVDRVRAPGYQLVRSARRTRTAPIWARPSVAERALTHAAVIVAAVVFHGANRDERIARTPLGSPQMPPRSTTAATADR